MPQKHKDGSKAMSIWLEPKDRELLTQLCDLGLIKDRSDFIRKAIIKKAKEEGLINDTRKK